MTAPPKLPPEQTWQQALQHAVRDLDELASLLRLPARELRALADAAPDFPLLVPRGFIARMRPGDLADPLLLQVLPQRREKQQATGFEADPLGELGFMDKSLMQKYPGRALLIASGACPVHCRYCFRREFPYQDQLASRSGWSPVLDALATRPDIEELLLSGGDPLSLSNRRLASLLEGLERLPSIQCLRIHTRFPVTIPERVDAELQRLLLNARLKIVVVIHSNHPNELDPKIEAVLQRLSAHTHLLLNQAVLLRGVNDDVDTLAALSRRLFECRVQPYYLHMLDRVNGTQHFETEHNEAKRLAAELRKRLPGYLVPRLVREVPGELSKTLI